MQNNTNQQNQYQYGYYVPHVPNPNVQHQTGVANTQPQTYTSPANNEYTSDMSGLHIEKSPNPNNDYTMYNVY